MVFLQHHAEELFWLQRRYTFLRLLDDLLDKDAPLEKAEEIAGQFSKVRDPKDLIARLEEIYPDHLM
jgi:hypothetical protein